MPPKKSLPARSSTRKTRQSARRREAVDNDVPSVYGEMLAEALAEERDSSSSLRSPKRRKLSEEPSSKIELDSDLFGASETVPDADTNQGPANDHPEKLQQVVYDDFEGSDESDVEFEDVELEPEPEPAGEDGGVSAEPEQKSLELDLSKSSLEPSRRGIQRRRPVGPAERKIRLEVHKAHLVCLLAHLSSRNRWCESESVQAVLKPLVPRKVIALLHVDESKPQYQRSHSFIKGIEEVCTIWRQQWTITAKGMQRAYWKDDADAVKESDDAEDLLDLDDFEAAAQSRSGSRDLGAQLLCALLRSVAVDTRLVCSLQVLPFSGVAKGQTPEKPKPQYYHAPPQNYTQNPTLTRPERATPKKKKIVESPYPIFWVEVYSPSTSTWIPLDPIVRNTINKPKTGFEPPASDRLNSMVYVMAMEDDGSAKDVTRRYTQWYNAKTRRQRVESTKGGERWWVRTLGPLQKPFSEVRDEIEDASLLMRAESEAMPRNVQDFKGHPVYVLERHLRMNEVIHPKHEVGKVSTGSGKNAKLESVFRRRHVHVCRTADAWYRRGRDVKEGEQPLKRVVSKRRRTPEDGEGDDDEASDGMALYAEYQTRLYEPPPVVDGKIPTNAYGNLDVYVPSMIPAGAVHIRHPLAAEAARVLEIDYADAVTGFSFRGRQGTAVIDGAVVSMNMCNAMINVIEGLESQATEETEQARSKVILGLWKRWLTALRVRERVHRDYGDREEDGGVAEDDDDDGSGGGGRGEHGGGFMLEEGEPGESGGPGEGKLEQDTDTRHVAMMSNLRPVDQLLPPEVVHQAIIVVRSPHGLPRRSPGVSGVESRKQAGIDQGGFLGEDGGHEVEGEDGGFLLEDEGHEAEAGAGGFLLEDEGHEAKADAETVRFFGEDKSQQHPLDTMEEDTGPGGFFAEEANMASPPVRSRTRLVTDQDQDQDIDATAGGFLVEDEEEEEEQEQSQTAVHAHATTSTTTTGQSSNANVNPKSNPNPNLLGSSREVAENTRDQEDPPTTRTKMTTTTGLDERNANTQAKADPIANAGADSNANADADADADADANANANANADADADTGTDTEGDTDTHPPPNSSPTSLRSQSQSRSRSHSQSSLLSHDPDEEDAEPEWLLNSLGEME
ncbi:hypothetical protein A1O3_01713 [Capronia epimyces CBS 606.96]|uniref:Xeroderma pigmentosum group C-complementing protein n=1 Tax=Capronia epimyces CBS 606.96 TaxID=1182542 RepID=W9YV62_9EURO|nr:uncharacterized protein A1O3_01713 [Capronia epimyces CBS 606.96]EXJ93156.1 hypothetical protein A1O3_01713 [Capronia epimyces CBS 606.96]